MLWVLLWVLADHGCLLMALVLDLRRSTLGAEDMDEVGQALAAPPHVSLAPFGPQNGQYILS